MCFSNMDKVILSVVHRTLFNFKADLREAMGSLTAEYLPSVLHLKLSNPLWLLCRALGFLSSEREIACSSHRGHHSCNEWQYWGENHTSFPVFVFLPIL